MEPFLLLYKLKKRDLSPHIYGGIPDYRVNNNMLLNRRFDTMNKDLMIWMEREEEELCPNCGNVLRPYEAESKTGLCDTCNMSLPSDSFDEYDEDEFI